MLALSALGLVLLPLPAPAGLIGVVGVLVVCVVADLVLAPDPGIVTVVRTFPLVVSLGETYPISWSITNPTNRMLRVDIADQLAPSLGAAERRFRARVAGSGTVVATTSIRPARRGRFVPSEMTLRVSGPLGLIDRQKTRQVPAELRVYPPFGSRKAAERAVDQARVLEVGVRSARGRGGGTDFDQLREYSTDDDSRRLDWAATARTGKAVVRTYQAEQNQTMLCLLDCGRTMAGTVEGVPRLEHAMDAILMLTFLAQRLGDRAGLVAFDRQIRATVAARPGRQQVARITEAVYQLQPALAESDFRTAFTETLSRNRRRMLLVILTELTDQATADTLVPSLPLVVRHHAVLIASVTDPDLVGWARSTATDPEAVYRKAAALDALDQRRRLTGRLGRLGAQVIDAPPGKLAPYLADAYLKIKATGRL